MKLNCQIWNFDEIYYQNFAIKIEEQWKNLLIYLVRCKIFGYIYNILLFL